MTDAKPVAREWEALGWYLYVPATSTKISMREAETEHNALVVRCRELEREVAQTFETLTESVLREQNRADAQRARADAAALSSQRDRRTADDCEKARDEALALLATAEDRADALAEALRRAKHNFEAFSKLDGAISADLKWARLHSQGAISEIDAALAEGSIKTL